MDRRTKLSNAQLYLVTGPQSQDWLEAALTGGVDIVQLRDKDATDDAKLIADARAFRAAADAHDGLFILNDRPDLVAATEADGVHVGQDDVPVHTARELVGADRIVGLSTHEPRQLEAARTLDVDYIAVGPVHATPTKPGRPAAGIGYVEHATERWKDPRPWFAIGGIDPSNVALIRAAGAHRIVVVRAITEADDPEQAARELKQAIGNG